MLHHTVVTSSPLSYLSDSSYYIPGNSVETPGSSIAHQYISGSVRFDDDDLANRYIAVHGNLNLDTEEKKSTHEVQDSPGADGDEVLSADSSLEDQERYGLFFIGEEESFAGSEEHSEQVPFSKFYVPPRGDYRESENRGAVLQTLPEVHPSSVYFDSPVSISETAPAYQTPSRPSSRYGSPKVSTSAPAYAAPSTERTYRPPTTEASPSTTERTYQQVTTESQVRLSLFVIIVITAKETRVFVSVFFHVQSSICKIRTQCEKTFVRHAKPTRQQSWVQAYQAPSTPYQDLGPSQAVAAAASQPNFVRAGNNIYIPEEYDESSIPGVAGVDYPVHHQVPETGFQCQAQQHPGLYADTDARCQ
ncbi:hypothetical protein HAZT_HAZT003785, partial [Hyalella azteca]